MPDAVLAGLVRRAGDGDQAAWDQLVDRFANLVWSVTRAHRLSDADAADVSQVTWLRLVENLGRLRDPGSVGSWLATTAKHECWRVLRAAGRATPVDDAAFGESPSVEMVDDRLLAAELHDALWTAFDGMTGGCRTLLRVLMADPPPTYEEVSAVLDMPIGSIGPTRGRCLDQLRARAAQIGITERSAASGPGKEEP